MSATDHSTYSSLREKLLEHIFVSELLKVLWVLGRRDIEVSRAEVDSGGYDIVLDCNGVTRHIQLKTSFDGSTTAVQKISLDLMKKPSGCVVWFKFDQVTLELGPYYFFGGIPGEKIPDLSRLKIAKHTKGNAAGIKADRPNHRIVPIAKFTKVESVNDLVELLFGLATAQSYLRADNSIPSKLGREKRHAKQGVPILVFHPNDEDVFKKRIIESKKAYIALYKRDLSVEYVTWRVNRFTLNSDLRKNIFSGPLRSSQKKGIIRAVFAVHKKDLQ